MAHPVYYQRTAPFSPIGSNSAVCLTDQLQPEEPAKVLLLEAGDPRSILFTIYSSGADASPLSRTLDFTCCEQEPAILARNVLLFSLIADDEAPEKIWNIFFHFYIDKLSLTRLISQCKKLIKLSETIQTWQEGTYGAFLRMCSSRTLDELRQYWTKYSKADEYSKLGKRLQKTFAARTTPQKETFEMETRCAMGLVLGINQEVFNETFKFESLFELFWKTGTTDPNPTDAATLPNPTFAYSLSGEGFFVDERTNPLLPFHLASAVASIRVGSKIQKGARNLNQVMEAVRVQFNGGCKSCRSILRSPGALVIRLFAGDPLAFLLALRRCSSINTTSPGIYSTQWSFSPLHLDDADYGPNATSRAPLDFNVIETSGLADRLGLLNVLTSTVPLLSRNASSVIYSETLLSYRGNEVTGFMDRLVVGMSMTSLMLGVAPSSYLTSVTSRSNTHEILAHLKYTQQPTFHDRIAWKFTTLGDTVVVGRNLIDDRPLVFNSQELAKFLFTVYLKMFSSDEVSPTDKLSSQDLQKRSWVRYVPESFAIFLRIVKARTDTDWRRVMETLFSLIEEDTTIPMGMSYYEDFCCQLHVHGVYTVDTLSPDRTPLEGPFKDRTSVPPLVCRKKLKDLNVPELEKIGLPLQCEVRVVTENRTTLRHIFPSVQTAFGIITVQKDSKRVAIVEDRLAWSGDDPLLVSFWVPSWLLTIEPDATTISLAIRQTPANTFLRRKLDLSTVSLHDPSIHVLDEQPNLGNTRNFASEDTSSADSPTHQAVVTLTDSCRDIETLSVRCDIIGKGEEQTWGSGATLYITQTSPCVMTVAFGRFERLLTYPYPVDGSRPKSRVARKSLYIEVIVPISGPGGPGGYSLNPFPVLLRDRKLALWNIHRVNCDRLPTLNILDSDVTGWSKVHFSLSMSTREKALHDLYTSSRTNHDNLLSHVKSALFTIILAGLEASSPRVLGFSQSFGGIDTLIFVTDVYLDLTSHTLVADAFILPLTVRLVPKLHEALLRLHQAGILSIDVFGEYAKALKRLVPIFTERCRRWEHTPTCEYLERGVVPLCVDPEKIPICSCGMGKDVDKFMKVPEWRDLGLEKLVTRAAIGQLFVASYLERAGPSENVLH